MRRLPDILLVVGCSVVFGGVARLLVSAADAHGPEDCETCSVCPVCPVCPAAVEPDPETQAAIKTAQAAIEAAKAGK